MFKDDIKQDIESEKQDIQTQKQDIDLQSFIKNRTLGLSPRIRQNIAKLMNAMGSDQIFGRSDVVNVLKITPEGEKFWRLLFSIR